MEMKPYQGAALIPLAVLFNIVINPASAVEFEPSTPVYSSATHDGVYKLEPTQDGKVAYKQVSAVIPAGDASKAVVDYLEPGTFSELSEKKRISKLAYTAHGIMKSDLKTQARKMSEKDTEHTYKFTRSLVLFDGVIEFWAKGVVLCSTKYIYFPEIFLKPVAMTKHTNLEEEFQQAGLKEGATKKDDMVGKFGDKRGMSDGYQHRDHTYLV